MEKIDPRSPITDHAHSGAPVLDSISALSLLPGPLFLAIGVFDGVHLGHRAVLDRARDDARRAGGTPVAVTFHPHPVRVLRPAHAPHLLTATPHKIRLIRALGIEHLLVIRFDEACAATPPEDFIHAIAAASHPLREICVGFEWCFGKGRAGDLALIKRLGLKLGFEEVGVPAVKIDGQVVSSTLIRRAVEAGDFATAARFLGREYTILGTVTEGAKLGRTIGFPTANLAAHNEQFPPNGVYAVEIARGAERLRGVANIGVRPTVANAGGERVFEVHIFDFARDIYGEDLEVNFCRFLRSERKFPNLDALKSQITTDAAEARKFFAS